MDIIIPVRETFDNDELRYCLRAIEANVPHRQVWIAGFKPRWASDKLKHIQTTVPDGPKFERALHNIKVLMECNDITEDVYFFNDDFFVMRPVKEIPYFHRGPLGETEKWKQHQMDYTADIVRHLGFDKVMDYSLHIPMKMNRKKWLEMWNSIRAEYDKPWFVRATYGTIYEVGGTYRDDCKIQEPFQKPTGGEEYLSTEDRAFSWGDVGMHIKGRFPKPSKYEVHQ